MVVLTALREALSTLTRNPVLFGITGLVALIQLPQLGVQALGPVVSTVVSMVFNLGFIVVFPFVQGGFLAMADEALDGRTTVETFVLGGKANYVQLLIGYAIVLGVNLGIGVGALVVLLGGGGILLILTPDPTGPLLLVLLGLLALIMVLVYLLIAFFIQFYGQAIVIDDLEAIEGFKWSIRLVRDNLVTTLGYSLLVGLVAGVFGLVIGGVSILLSLQAEPRFDVPDIPIAGLVGIAFGVLVVTTLVTAVLMMYSVAFYRSIRDETVSDGPLVS